MGSHDRVVVSDAGWVGAGVKDTGSGCGSTAADGEEFGVVIGSGGAKV